MNLYLRTLRILAVLVTVLIVAGAAVADDPPSRVMRLRYMSGQVSMQPGGVNDWVEAAINRPLTTADRIWADKDSRAELSLGSAALRVKDETSMTVSNLNDNTVQIELDQGTLNLRVRQMNPGEIYEIDTPNLAFTLLKPGDYRFEVDSERDETLVIVRKGDGEATGDGRGVRIRSGEEARFEHGDTLMHQTAQARGLDGFDDWCRARDKREDSADSLRYVPADMVGYEDLDEHGTWSEVPEYGPVWRPRHVVVDWAPYRYGHWVWIEPWGWTWVDDAPWGFAPFHYGRWVYVGGSWGWCPGPRHVRPVYAPALVAWVGGRNWGVGVSVGAGVGWVPLGYGEPYYPSYRVSNVYVRNVNVTNTRITNITYVTNNYTVINRGGHIDERYANQHVAGGVTVVRQDAFAGGHRVSDARVRISDRDAMSAPRVDHIDAVPMRGSVLGVNQGQRAAIPPARAVGRPVWVKQTPPERPVGFEQRRTAIERNGGRPLDDMQMRELRSQRQPAVAPRAAEGQQQRIGNVAPGQADRAPRSAAPEMRGVREGDASVAPRHGRTIPRPSEQNARQGEGAVSPERLPRTEETVSRPASPHQSPATPEARTERMPRVGRRAESGTTSSSPNEQGTSGWRGNHRNVPQPPRGADGTPNVTRAPENRDERQAPRAQESERGSWRRQQEEQRPQQQNVQERVEHRQQQQSVDSGSRAPVQERREVQNRPEPQQRPQVQQREERQAPRPRQSEQKKEERREEKAPEAKNWHQRGGTRGE